MKQVIGLILGALIIILSSELWAENLPHQADLEVYDGIDPAEQLIMIAPLQHEIDFSPEGLEVMSFLAGGGLEGKNFRHSRNITLSFGAVTALGAVATAPTIVGPLVFLMLGGSATLLAGANTVDEKVLARPQYNLGRLIKASYVHLGWNSPSLKKLGKHNKRIKGYIKKYLDNPADEECIDFVARSIAYANEKGWFGFIVPTVNPKNQNKTKLIYVAGSITGRKGLREVLFPNNRLSTLIHRDSSISDKVKSYHQKFPSKNVV
ncbi:MAG: hypothetical protein HRU09_14395 [Oligoflexales bacterium]|nr:hypothetical protein [Oligoflexales bacterium]